MHQRDIEATVVAGTDEIRNPVKDIPGLDIIKLGKIDVNIHFESLSSPRWIRKPDVLRTLRVIEFASEDRSLSSSPSHNRIEKRYQRQPHPRRKRHCPIRGKNNCENPSQALVNLSLAGYIFLISHCASSGSGGVEGAILRSIESNDGSSSLSHSRISRRCSSLKPISIRAYSFGMTPAPFAYSFITASALAA